MSDENKILLLLDEDVWSGLAIALQDEEYDVVSVNGLGRKGFSDTEQLMYAVSAGRDVLTHNANDFVSLAKQYFDRGESHYGVIITPHLEKGALFRRVLFLLQATTREQLMNSVRFA